MLSTGDKLTINAPAAATNASSARPSYPGSGPAGGTGTGPVGGSLASGVAGRCADVKQSGWHMTHKRGGQRLRYGVMACGVVGRDCVGSGRGNGHWMSST